jgi:hypothetical protein
MLLTALVKLPVFSKMNLSSASWRQSVRMEQPTGRQRQQQMEQVLGQHHPRVLRFIHGTQATRRASPVLGLASMIAGAIVTAARHQAQWLAYGITIFFAVIAAQIVVFFISAAIVGHYLDRSQHSGSQRR